MSKPKTKKENNYIRIPKPTKHLKNGLLLLLGLALGIVIMAFLYNPLYQGKTAKDWTIQNTKTTKDYAQQLSDLNKKYASVSADLQKLLNAPTPTPNIKYIDKTPSHPNLSSCNREGNFYFCPEDNCYYNPNGTRTGVCNVAPPGGF